MIFNRILKRDLYRYVDYKVIDWPFQHTFRGSISPERVFKSVQALLPTSNPLSSTEVSVFTLHEKS